MSNLAVGISIGAVLAGSFEQAVSSAPKKLAKIGAVNRPGFRVGYSIRVKQPVVQRC